MPLMAGVAAHDNGGDDEVRGVADEIWNLLGRPANDPVYDVLFPGGTGFYVDGDVNEQPDMMLLLAELLESNVHPKLGADGAFYMFIKAPWGTATDFVKKAIENELLIIPGNVFSSEDTHFRLSYAAKDETLLRGAEVLRKIAKG